MTAEIRQISIKIPYAKIENPFIPSSKMPILYWKKKEWILENNHKVIATHDLNYRQAIKSMLQEMGIDYCANTAQYVDRVQAEIDLFIDSDAGILYDGHMSVDTLNYARKFGWDIPDITTSSRCSDKIDELQQALDMANEQIKMLQNRLNADSQNFQIECQKAEIELLKKKYDELLSKSSIICESY